MLRKRGADSAKPCRSWGLNGDERDFIMGTGVNMRSTTKTRVQRRLEKKQLGLIVLLILVIALTSFALGVIVGRSSVEPVVVQQSLESQRIPVAGSTESQPAEERPLDAATDDRLTFYDNLSKEEPEPVGSGINLPPADTASIVEEEAAAEPLTVEVPTTATDVVAAVAADAKPVVETVAKPGVSTPAAPSGESLPEVTREGRWVVQVFSSRSAADAGTYRDELNAKGYPASIAEADLGDKGIWYRVLFGPYADKDIALQAKAYAEKKDQLKGFAKRR